MMSMTMMARRTQKLALFFSSSSAPLYSGRGWFSSKSSTDVAAVDVADVSAEEELLYREMLTMDELGMRFDVFVEKLFSGFISHAAAVHRYWMRSEVSL